jgi:hypothetical protein
MRSGVPRLRLCRDATQSLVQRDSARKSAFDGKHVIEPRRPEAVTTESSNLKAIYLLAPFEPDEGEHLVRRVRLVSHAATLLLVRHARIGRVLSGSAAGDMVIRAAAVARAVPVYVLHVMRDLGRIHEVAAELMHWHGEPAMAAVAEGR